MLNEMDNMHRVYCTIGCIRKVTNEYIGRSEFAAQLIFIFSGLERLI